jgi:hypothetical protein
VKEHVMKTTEWQAPDCVARVEPSDREVGRAYDLVWTDGINEWVEEFPTESVALLRLAALARCAESEWQRLFKVTPEEFTRLAGAFLDRVTA